MNTKKNKAGSRPCDLLPYYFKEEYLIKEFSKAKHNENNNNRELDSSGMDIPDYAYERLARCMLPIMRAYFEREKETDSADEFEREDTLRRAA